MRGFQWLMMSIHSGYLQPNGHQTEHESALQVAVTQFSRSGQMWRMHAFTLLNLHAVSLLNALLSAN